MIVLDTHALVWWASEPTRIPAKARKRIESAIESGERLGVSSISLWEVARLIERGRLSLTIDASAWLAHVQALRDLAFHPVDNTIAIVAARSADYPGRDPADRMIVATARTLDAALVTADREMHAYRPLTAIWD